MRLELILKFQHLKSNQRSKIKSLSSFKKLSHNYPKSLMCFTISYKNYGKRQVAIMNQSHDKPINGLFIEKEVVL